MTDQPTADTPADQPSLADRMHPDMAPTPKVERTLAKPTPKAEPAKAEPAKAEPAKAEPEPKAEQELSLAERMYGQEAFEGEEPKSEGDGETKPDDAKADDAKADGDGKEFVLDPEASKAMADTLDLDPESETTKGFTEFAQKHGIDAEGAEELMEIRDEANAQNWAAWSEQWGEASEKEFSQADLSAANDLVKTYGDEELSAVMKYMGNNPAIIRFATRIANALNGRS